MFHLVGLRVGCNLGKNHVNFFHLQVHDVVHYALRHGGVLGKLVEIELGFGRERVLNIGVEVDGKQAA